MRLQAAARTHAADNRTPHDVGRSNRFLDAAHHTRRSVEIVVDVEEALDLPACQVERP